LIPLPTPRFSRGLFRSQPQKAIPPPGSTQMGNVNRALFSRPPQWPQITLRRNACARYFQKAMSQPARAVSEFFSWGAWLAMNGNEHKRLRALLVA